MTEAVYNLYLYSIFYSRHPQSTPQFRQATFQIPNSPLWLVVTILHSTAWEKNIHMSSQAAAAHGPKR